MKRDAALLLAGFVLGVLCYSITSTLFLSPIILPIFSPDGGSKIISAIENAESSIDIEMYVFTSEETLDALKRAHNRGVKIRVILERRVVGGSNEEMFNLLSSYGIDVRWASKTFKLTHAKFMIIDGKKVIVGSHNFSDSALTLNRETSVLLERTDVVEQFKSVFENDWMVAA